jgi:hypothetical protein
MQRWWCVKATAFNDEEARVKALEKAAVDTAAQEKNTLKPEVAPVLCARLDALLSVDQLMDMVVSRAG